ncbi:hypothetical protein [Flavobacterium xinjiangense]|uniref:Repeat domain-containing protein n=1 Tax=Flavobacterium xinjiangense TaxID=178356 RepID=A0A1M7J5T6_9FLAO|nr:hypothetical protein [Flavobacterium xinjiangense]SHM48479.1 hypothetical protein SAMN05216269_104331 [Flavobacterium xinjiangense]
MKKAFLFLSLVALAGLFSCKKEAAENKIKTDSLTFITDSSKVNKKSTELDPDPNDTIPASQYGINSSSLKTASLVRLTLKNIFKEDLEKNWINETSRKFIFFEYDLNDDGKKEILVGLTGSYFYGSGGCTQYILDNQGNVISKFTVANNPVVIDTHKSNGWKDLIIYSGGKNRLVKFNGKKYPSNPSMQPELKMIPGDGLPRALNFINEPYPWFLF